MFNLFFLSLSSSTRVGGGNPAERTHDGFSTTNVGNDPNGDGYPRQMSGMPAMGLESDTPHS